MELHRIRNSEARNAYEWFIDFLQGLFQVLIGTLYTAIYDSDFLCTKFRMKKTVLLAPHCGQR